MAAGRVPKRADWRVADGVRVEELDGSWLALDPAGGVVYRLEARAAEVMRLVAHRLPLPGHLVPAARELAGHGVLEHPFVDRRTALVGAGVVTLTGLAATMLPSAARAASVVWTEPGGTWPATGGDIYAQSGNFYVHVFKSSDANTEFTLATPAAVAELSVLVVAGGGSGGRAGTGAGGGGGGGGVILAQNVLLEAGAYAVTVGDGGIGDNDENQGLSGSNSSFRGPKTLTETTALVAVGGGGGGGPDTLALTGGSSGGGGGDDGSGDQTTATGVDTGSRLTTVRSGSGSVFTYGNTGGVGYSNETSTSNSIRADRRGAGGGGAGSFGVSPTGPEMTGAGGAAVSIGAFVVVGSGGSSVFRGVVAGGGGGAGGLTSPSTAAGAGGAADGFLSGGNGGYGGSSNPGQNGATNTGGGGGGSVGAKGGDGGSGIVLVRYRLAS